MLDFSTAPVIDNHSHPLNPGRDVLSPERLAREFYHGKSDLPQSTTLNAPWEASGEVWGQLTRLGVVETAVCQLATLFGCEPDLSTVSTERNRRTTNDFAAYIKMLYEDAAIVGTVVDSALAPADPVLTLIPGRIMRLFQMGPVMLEALAGAASFGDFLNSYHQRLEAGIRAEGFVGVKTHLGEEVGFGGELPTLSDAMASFGAAQAGDKAALKRVYATVFSETMLHCQELGVPVHIHAGITGGTWNGPISDTDPFLLVPVLQRSEFIRTRVILLHGAYPWTQHAAMVAHALPHVWVDLSWTTPWISLRLAEVYREIIALAPLSKVMIGSGGHGTPEIAWLAAKTAKIALRRVLGDALTDGMLSRVQAERIGGMILHDNAAGLYGLAD